MKFDVITFYVSPCVLCVSLCVLSLSKECAPLIGQQQEHEGRGKAQRATAMLSIFKPFRTHIHPKAGAS